VHPILGGIADEAALRAASGAIAFDGVAAGANDVVELGQLDDVGVEVVFEEGLSLKAGGEDGLEHPLCAFLRLLV
jgi:hypothetical protein